MNWKTRLIGFLSGLLRPGRRSACIAAPLSWLLRTIAPRKEIATQNLEIALLCESPERKREILSGTYNHMIWTALEFIMLQRDPSQVLEWVDTDEESLERLEALRGKRAILLTGHVGNWELTAAWIAQMGHKVTAIVRESDDSTERGMIENMRSRLGIVSMSKRLPMNRAVSLLRREEFLGILPDQHGGNEGIQVPFFGVQTSTPQGAAVFAYLTGAPLIPVFTHRIAPCRHVIRIAPPIEWSKRENRDSTILDITGKINGVVEQMVLEAPDQWLAQHKRFKGHYR